VPRSGPILSWESINGVVSNPIVDVLCAIGERTREVTKEILDAPGEQASIAILRRT
jgi:hypothetical protein